MADRKIEDYKKSITKCVDKWNSEHAKVAGQVAEIVKQIDALKKQVSAVCGKAAEAVNDLGVAIMNVKVPDDGDEKELAKVPAWLEQLIKSKCASNKQFISVDASAEFSGKPKALVVTASWYFHDAFSKLE